MDKLFLWIIFFIIEMVYSFFHLYFYIQQDDLQSGRMSSSGYAKLANKLAYIDIAVHFVILFYYTVIAPSLIPILILIVPTVIIARRKYLNQIKCDSTTILRNIDREILVNAIKGIAHFLCCAYCLYRLIKVSTKKPTKGRYIPPMKYKTRPRQQLRR